MTHNEIMGILNRIPAGRFFRMKYSSEMKVKAEHKKKGISVTKVTETTVRTGVAYANISAVAEYKATHEPKRSKPATNNWEWVSPNRVKYNTNTKKTYAVVATVPNGSNSDVYYIVTDANGSRMVTPDELDKSLMQDSAWGSGSYPNSVRTIAFDNIIEINA